MTRPALAAATSVLLPSSAEPWRLVQADCLQVLGALPAASADLVFADPPYNLSNGGTTCRGGRRASVDKGSWDASRGLELDHAYNRRWLAAVQRVLKPSGTLWVSGTQHVIFSIGFAMQQLGFHLLNSVTWQKTNAPPNLSCRYLTHSTELLLWASPSRQQPLAHRFNYKAMKRVTGRQMRDVWIFDDEKPDDEGHQVIWTVPTPPPREKTHGRHPTQKPFALLQRVLLASSQPGDLVLDPFAGSGTTGVAALAHGRRFLGIERDAAYAALARRRLSSPAPISPQLTRTTGA